MRFPVQKILSRYSAVSHQLTRFYGSQSGQEGNRVHDALLPLKASRFQDPCGCRMDNEDVKEKTRETRKVVADAVILVAHGDGVAVNGV